MSPFTARLPKVPRSPDSPGATPEKEELQQQWLANAVEVLRDHPVFEVPDPETGEIADQAALITPSDREREWRSETRRLFIRRCAVTTAVAVTSLPVFWLIYVLLAPHAWALITSAQLSMLCCCLMVNIAVRRARSLSRARGLTLVAYLVFGLCASTVLAGAKEPRISAFSGHETILISLLFIPFSLVETGLCALFIVTSFAVGYWSSLAGHDTTLFWPRVAALGFSALLMVVMAHLQNLVRRQAFDSAFDMALAASRGAALSNLDAVTGGYNRRHLETMMELELSRANRFSQPLSVVMFDLDNFKIVNDTNGHLAGDEVLREVLDAATSALRGIDTVARYGGDEFMVILPGTAREAATGAAYRLRALVLTHLREHFPAGSLESKVTLSLGVAYFAPSEVVTVEEAIERADNHLYTAKRLGKDCVYAG